MLRGAELSGAIEEEEQVKASFVSLVGWNYMLIDFISFWVGVTSQFHLIFCCQLPLFHIYEHHILHRASLEEYHFASEKIVKSKW